MTSDIGEADSIIARTESGSSKSVPGGSGTLTIDAGDPVRRSVVPEPPPAAAVLLVAVRGVDLGAALDDLVDDDELVTYFSKRDTPENNG